MNSGLNWRTDEHSQIKVCPSMGTVITFLARELIVFRSDIKQYPISKKTTVVLKCQIGRAYRREISIFRYILYKYPGGCEIYSY